MSGIRKFSIFIFRIFAAVNIVVIVAMCAMGYAGMVSPEKHPSYEVLTLFFPIPLVINLVFLVFWLFVRRRYMWIPILGLLLCLPVIRSYCPLNIPQKAPEIFNPGNFLFCHGLTIREVKSCSLIILI